MKKIFTLVFLSVCFNFYGQIGFEHNKAISRYDGDVFVNGIVTGDFDNDGKIDVAHTGFNQIIWHKNVGQGDFDLGKRITDKPMLTSQWKKISGADMNGDGLIDLVTSLYFVTAFGNGNGIYFIKSNGNGTFAEPIVIDDYNISTSDFTIAEINGDGKPDIIAKRGTEMRWYKNDGAGGFTLQPDILANTNGNTIYFTDVTGDNIADMLSTDNTQTKIFKNNGNGTFTLIQTLSVVLYEFAFAAADIDTDGNLDIIFKSPTGLKWAKNNSGVFQAQQAILTTGGSTPTPATANVLITDFNADGKPDIALIAASSGKIVWYKNLGNAIFANSQNISTDTANDSDLVAGDITGDGKPELLAASITVGKVSWYKNIPTGFTAPVTIGRTAYDVNYAEAGDIDGDGDADLVSASTSINQLSWYKNGNGQGDFTIEKQYVIDSYLTGAKNVKLHDVDSDGDLDILAESSSACYWYKNNGLGSFTKATIVPANTSNGTFFYADVDADGDIDIISFKENEISIRKNNGNGTFAVAQSQTPWTGNSASNIRFADMDGDGKQDLLVCFSTMMWGSPLYNWYWHKNDGQGTFSGTANDIGAINSANSFYLADFDSDGDMDVVYFSGAWIGWFQNLDGNGNFSQATHICTSPSGLFRIYIHDIDGDGHKDIISAKVGTYKLAWFKNNGQQTAGAPIEISSATGNPNMIGIADFNADGRPDIYTSSKEDHSVNAFINQGILTNTISGTVRLNTNGTGCTLADPGIGPILVSAQRGNNTWSVFTNPNGNYALFAGQGTYTTSVTSPLPSFTVTPVSQVSTFANNSGESAAVNFCLQAIAPVSDLDVIIYPLTNVRPGFPVKYKVIVKNKGTLPATATMQFVWNTSKLNFNSSSPAQTSASGNTLIFNLGTMAIFQVKEFTINFTAKTIPAITLGDEVIASANLVVTNDANPADNTVTHTEIVVGSYDPNDIAVREGSQILLEDADEYLHYLIRFQNTGNYYAERVVVKNPLDSKLDWTTMQIESMSHTGRAEIINGAEATFTFDAIYLPAMTVNEPASHGYIAYKIKPKANVALGDTFTEQAHIYFDFNPAIDTNIVTTTIVDNVNGVPQFTAETVSVYPVPSKAVLNVKANSDIAKIEIYNQAGQRVLANTMQNSIDISALSHGIYFAKIENVHSSSVTKKVVKN